MNHLLKVARRKDVLKLRTQMLIMEQDYWLATLSHAIGQNDVQEKDRALTELRGIASELVQLHEEMKG